MDQYDNTTATISQGTLHVIISARRKRERIKSHPEVASRTHTYARIRIMPDSHCIQHLMYDIQEKNSFSGDKSVATQEP